MNVRQKVGLYIMVPAFVLAVGHTVINKINMNKEAAKTEVLPDITDALKMKSKEAATVFKAQQELLIKFKENNSKIEDIPIDKINTLSVDSNQH